MMQIATNTDYSREVVITELMLERETVREWIVGLSLTVVLGNLVAERRDKKVKAQTSGIP